MTDLLERCRGIATSTWSDVLDTLGVDGVMRDLTVRSGAGRIAGNALTVKETARALGGVSVEAFAVGRFLDAIEPGQVLVVDLGGAEVSTFGGLAARAAVLRGAAGAVIDGGCRDVDDIRATGLWVSSRHLTPVSGKGRVCVDALDVPIVAGGVAVEPGDYIVGDETGVVRIRANIIVEALHAAEEFSSRDRRFAESLGAGNPFTETLARIRYV